MRGLIVDYVGVLDRRSDTAAWQQLFATARSHGIRLAVLSNDFGGPGAEPIRAWRTDGHVDAVLLSGEVGYWKPEPEIFLAAAQALNLPAEECLMVDDSIANVQGAIRVGMAGILHLGFERTASGITQLFGFDAEL